MGADRACARQNLLRRRLAWILEDAFAQHWEGGGAAGVSGSSLTVERLTGAEDGGRTLLGRHKQTLSLSSVRGFRESGRDGGGVECC